MKRFQEKELKKAIKNVKKNLEGIEKDDSRDIIYIDERAAECHKENQAVAKRVLVGGGITKYYFLYTKTPGNEIYNPFSSSQKTEAHRISRLTGRPRTSFQEVTKEQFNCYLNFLQTKNQTWLRKANREC